MTEVANSPRRVDESSIVARNNRERLPVLEVELIKLRGLNLFFSGDSDYYTGRELSDSVQQQLTASKQEVTGGIGNSSLHYRRCADGSTLVTLDPKSRFVLCPSALSPYPGSTCVQHQGINQIDVYIDKEPAEGDLALGYGGALKIFPDEAKLLVVDVVGGVERVLEVEVEGALRIAGEELTPPRLGVRSEQETLQYLCFEVAYHRENGKSVGEFVVAASPDSTEYLTPTALRAKRGECWLKDEGFRTDNQGMEVCILPVDRSVRLVLAPTPNSNWPGFYVLIDFDRQGEGVQTRSIEPLRNEVQLRPGEGIVLCKEQGQVFAATGPKSQDRRLILCDRSVKLVAP